MVNTFLFLIGFGFTIIGFMYIITYLNFMTIGYNFTEYLAFIGTRFECLLAIIGIILITIVIFKKGEKNDIHI